MKVLVRRQFDGLDFEAEIELSTSALLLRAVNYAV